ncbi:MAG: 4Fe-4S dicluster-binding protein [Bacillota bacterium]|jgi:Fe-S-cluster-containing dehydrogenase component
MIIKDTCIKCRKCIPYCPVQAIYVAEDKSVTIDLDKCVECEICRNAKVCPTDSLQMQELDEYRTIRNQFSNPLISHPDTGVPGRGTEEMKTNEVTGRFKRGQAGIAIEMGRPGTSTTFADVEKVAMALAPLGIHFEPYNPVTSLMTDKSTGKLRDDVLNERVLSAIIEFDLPQDKVVPALEVIRDVSTEISTVFSLDLACRLEPDGRNPAVELANKAGFRCSLNGKTNVGLGRPLAKEE